MSPSYPRGWNMPAILAIEANRLNPQTGPRSIEGKAASSMNALKTGIYAESAVIRGESAAVLQQLAAEYHERFSPATPEERFLVDTLVHDEWLLRRFRRIEAQLFLYEMEDYLEDEEVELARAFHAYAPTFARLQRRISEAERSYLRVLKELERLRATRTDSPQAVQPPQAQPVAAAVKPVGFVPQPVPEAAPDPRPAAFQNPSGQRRIAM